MVLRDSDKKLSTFIILSVIRHVPNLKICAASARPPSDFTTKSVKLELVEEEYPVCDLLRLEQWGGILHTCEIWEIFFFFSRLIFFYSEFCCSEIDKCGG